MGRPTVQYCWRQKIWSYTARMAEVSWSVVRSENFSLARGQENECENFKTRRQKVNVDTSDDQLNAIA